MSKVWKTKDYSKKCHCPECPSYDSCAKKTDEKLFCAEDVGKSSCDFGMLGCTCGDCPVHEENNLEYGYYCIHGSASYVYRMNKMI